MSRKNKFALKVKEHMEFSLCLMLKRLVPEDVK